MQKQNRKIYAAIIVIVVLLSAFFVVTQYQIKVIEDDSMPMTVKIFADKSEGTVPFSVNFSSIVTNNKGDVEYEWDFGNSETSTEREPKVSYDVYGEYVCSLKVTDKEGDSEDNSIIITAKKNKPPMVTLSINQNTVDRRLTWLSFYTLLPAKFFAYPGNYQEILDKIEEKQGADAWGEGKIVVTAQVSDPEDDEIVSYEWREQTSDSLLKANGDSVLPVHYIEGNESIRIPELYTWTPFEHVVILTVTDSAGNKANATTYFTVSRNNTRIKLEEQGKLLIQVLLLQVYNQLLPEEYKHLVSDPLWKIFEPICKVIPIGSVVGNIFPPPIPQANLNISFDDNKFNHSATINQNGGVTNKSEISHSFNIRNDDESNTAKGVYIKLSDPIDGEEGLAEAIENDKVTVTLKTANTNEILYGNSIYTDGFLIGDLTPGSEFNAKLIVTFLEAENGTYTDDTSYNCSLYVYQQDSDYWRWGIGIPPIQRLPLDEIKFTVET